MTTNVRQIPIRRHEGYTHLILVGFGIQDTLVPDERSTDITSYIPGEARN